ncbi:TIGR02588 family protein [Microcoleus vaginatus GB1-A2]|uniref:TIGR02588 family protein n=1 Tax=Microcoleus vaginatus TaxID=119532 RepID=UPI001687F78A|nr:TIGR02588 family protein [Microcoleus sp. FACHB-61]
MTESNNEQQQKRTFAEWVTFAIASFILATLVGLVLYNWVTKKQEPPVISVTRNAPIRETQGHFYVPFTVTNTGGEAAASVQIIAELRVNGEVLESGDQQIDFLSSGETQEGAFIFSRDPSQGQLIVRSSSYKLP